MAENIFDAYDEAAPTLTAGGPATEDENPFSAFDGEQPPQPEAPANQPPAPITPVQNMPGVSVIDDPEMRDILDQFAAHNIREGTDKISESRGNSFIDGVTDPQQYLETGKGVVPGAIKFGGTTLKGAGAVKAAAEVNVAKFAHERLAVLDRLERGEPAQPQRFGDLTGMASARDATGYASLTPAQRAAERARLERLLTGYTPTPAEQQSLFKAGEKVTEYAKTVLPPAPGYEEAVGRQLGEGIGSLVAGLPAGWLGRIPAAAFFGAGGAGEAVERAIEFDRKEKKAGRPGLTQDQINASALWGVAPGTTDLLPIEMLFGRLKIPAPFSRLAARAVARIGGQAFVEGMQEGGQQFLQNLIAQEIYNPEQTLGEGVMPNIAMGGGVGAAAQAAKETARLALRSFAGRRGGSAPSPSPSQAAPTGAPQATATPAQAPSAGAEAPSQTAKAPTSQPDAAAAPQVQRDAAPETRAATREQFNQYLALEDRLASIPDDMDAPPDLINQAIDAEEAMVEAFRATGLPGDGLARGTRPIESMEDVKRAFDEATPEEINEFWQGKAVGPAASGAALGAGAAAQGSQTGQASAPARAEEGGASAAPAGAPSNLRLEKSGSSTAGATVYDAMIDDVAHAQVSIKLHPKDKSVEVLSIGNDRKQGKLKPEFVGKIKAALAQQFPDYETAFGQEVGERSPLRPAARDLTTDFLRLIATPTPRDQWAKTLGVTEDELMPHVERAIASGLLRVDRNGVVRRNASAVAEMEPEVEAEGQKIEAAIESGAGPMLAPGIIEGENATLTPKAIDKIQELKAIAEEAVAKILPRDVRIEVVDNIAIDRLAHEDALLALRALHASPYDFDSFSTDNIGTGEGAQAFGWGLYFAESDKVMGRYALSVPDQQLLREAKEAYSEFDDPDTALEELLASPTLSDRQRRFLSALANDDWFGFDYPHQAIRAALRENPKNWDASQETLDAIKGLSTRYEVNINAEPEDFIDWDAPLMGQPVFDKLAKMHFANDVFTDAQRMDYMRQAFPDEGMTGADYYRKMIRQFGSDKAASEFMAKSGVAGIRYLDQVSRRAGEGTRNIVVFDDKLVEVVSKDGKPVSARAAAPLFSLRSSKSAKVSEGTEGESDESGLQEDSGEAGQAGDDASRSSNAGAIAAAVGGGGASGASTTEGRILRQESATLREDGSIRAGRISTKAKAAQAGGLDAEALQPVGTSEFFDAAGLRGVVTAMPVADHAGLARRGAPASEYRLANLTYRLYAPDAPLTEAQLTNFQPNFRAGGDFHAPLIWARVSQHMDGTWEVSMVQRIADRESAPKGMANKLYAAIEKDLGIRMSPSGILSKQGLAMWKKRSPESVKWHQWSKHEGYFISPRRIKDNIARIGMDLADIAARPDADPNKAEDHAIALSERKELIKLWTKLPLEARGSTPNTMFSLRAYHGTPHDFDRFDLSKIGTGEGAQAFGHGLYFAENEGVAKSYREQLAPLATKESDFLPIESGEAVDFLKAHPGETFGDAIDERFDYAFPRMVGRKPLWVFEDGTAILGAGGQQKAVKAPGALYEVELDVEPHQLLDYDARLASQPEMLAKLETVLRDAGSDVSPDILRTQPGSWAYSELEVFLGSADAASRALREAGIPGLRYLDQGSREKSIIGTYKGSRDFSDDEMSTAVNMAEQWGSTKRALQEMEGATFPGADKIIGYLKSGDIELVEPPGTRNIVIFDDSLIKITHKNGKAVSTRERKAVVGEMFSLRGFHGSPHHFDRFSMGAIGTGEGAQAYGHGLYFAENKSIADHYRKALSVGRNGPSHLVVDGKRINVNDAGLLQWVANELSVATNQQHDGVFEGDVLDGLRDTLTFNSDLLLEDVFGGAPLDDSRAEINAALDLVESLYEKPVEFAQDEGALYEVEIDIEPEQLLDWDARVSEQPEPIRKAIEKVLPQSSQPEIQKMKGGDLMHKLHSQFGKAGAADALYKAGVPGLRYLDASSRGLTMNGKLVPDHLRHWAETKADGELDAIEAIYREQVEKFKREMRRGDKNSEDFSPFVPPNHQRQSAELLKDAQATLDQILEVQAADVKADGTRNIVIFDDNLIKITRKNGEPVTAAERKAVVDEMLAKRSTRESAEQDFQALGQTNPDAKIISIGARAIEAESRATGKSEKKITIETARHEALEFFLAKGFIRPDEWATLVDVAVDEGWVEAAGVRDPYTKQFGETMDAAQLEDLILKESIMVKYGEYERGNYEPKGLVAKIFKRIKDFLDRLRNSLKSQGFQRWEDIFQKMDAGEMRQRYEARFGRPAKAAKNRVTSKAVPAGGRIAAMTLPGLAQNAPLSPAPAGPTPGRAASAPGSLVDIQRNLRRKLGLTVASGRLDPAAARAAGQAGGKLMGQFDRQTEVIRLRTLQDIDTEAHEVAHALENRYAGLANLQQAHAQELSGVANLTGQSGLSEGFAEFFRLYLTNPPAADAHAPKFRAAFEDFLETQDAQTLQDIQEIQAQYQQWRNASSAGRITAAVKSGVPDGTWEKIRAEYDRGGLTRVGGMFWAYLEQVYKSRIDRTNPIRVLVERIARQAEAVNQDIDLSAWRNPQAQARKIPAADGVAYMDITRGVGWENSAGRGSISLRDALSTAFGGTGYEHWTPQQRDDFGAYLIARRGRWLWQRHDMDPARNRGRMANPPQNPQPGDWYFDTMTRQRRVYLRGRWETELTRAPDKHTRADHEQAVADLEAANPQFAVAAQMVYQFNRDLALKRFQAGLDSQEEFDYKNGATDYVPWFRDMTDAIFAGTGVSGRKVQGKFKIRGSYRDFINPVEGIIRQVYDTNREIAVNKPKLLLAQLADTVQGAGKFAEIIPATRMVTQEVRVREALAQAAKQEGLPPEDAKDMISAVAAMIGDDAVATLFRVEQAGEAGDAILHYMEGGELKMVQIHDDERGIARDILGFFEALKHTPAADSLFGAVTAAVRVPQKAITSSLGFVYRNLIRDAMQASVLQAGYFPIVSNIRTVASNRSRRARGEEGWGELLARHGGIMGGIGRTDVQQIKQGRVAEMRTDAVTLKPWERQFWKQTVNPWHEDFWRWAEWSEANARQTLARISFDRAIKDVQSRYPTMPADQQTFVALESAVQRSRDYTDYSRMGDAPSQAFLNRMVMFLNPSLQGPDKMIRAMFLAQTNEGRFAAAQLVRKKLAPLFDDSLQYKNLTSSERDALKDGLRAWVTILIIAHTHLLLEIAFNDPDELEDKSKLERATSVSFTINGVDYRIPRGFDLVNFTSNMVKATYDSWQREDPTAWPRFRETLTSSLLPAHSSPILDLYSAVVHGRNTFFGTDIEPTYLKGVLPEDRYKAYTSGLAKDIAKAVNESAPFEVSPLMVEYVMNLVGADWSRDIMRAYDVADPSKPALRWQEYPFLRAARGLRGTRGAEEFWKLMGQEGSFTQAGASYRDEAVKSKAWSRDDIRKFFDKRLKDDDAKAYSVMIGHYNAEQRRLHPMERAKEFGRGISGTMRDVASNRIDVPVTSKMEKRVEVSREVRAQALEILGEIGRREYRNALIALKRPGYENREPQPVKPYLNELKTISPEIHKNLIARITNADGSSRVYDYDKVRELWPETRKRLLSAEKRERIIETQGDVEFGDLTARAQGAKAMGIR